MSQNDRGSRKVGRWELWSGECVSRSRRQDLGATTGVREKPGCTCQDCRFGSKGVLISGRVPFNVDLEAAWNLRVEAIPYIRQLRTDKPGET